MPVVPQTRSRRWWLLALAAVAAVLALLYGQADKIVLGAEGYLFGYPLVITDVTRENATAVVGPANTLRRVRQFPDAAFRGVVRPNVDTLYTTAFIDMSAGPWVFEMPANDRRYELMAFLDAWTNVFAAPGTRSNGQAGGRFLLVGPGWQGEVPDGLSLLRSPTRIVWLIGRTQTDGIADYDLVHGLQDGLALRTLAAWQADAAARTPASTPASTPAATPVGMPAGSGTSLAELAWRPAEPPPVPPHHRMHRMSTSEFFARLASLMADNPPVAADDPMLRKLARIGVAPGRPPEWGPLDNASVALGRWIADRRVAQELKAPRELVRGWASPPAMLGRYGTHYNIRAVVAMVGLGANLPEDATYPNARVDADGRALNGSSRYRLHFAADALPPVKAFWSVTAYGADDFLIDNPLNRHALGSRDPLVFNPDGSLDLWVQATAPDAARLPNWLPVRAGEPFLLNARLYWPEAAALDDSWGMPAIERLD
jgi:hypothetical protein